MSSIKAWSLFGVALWIVLALIHPTLVTPERLPYTPHSDVITEHLATKQVLHDSLTANGSLPAWRWDEFSGSAATTNPQSQYEHPAHALFYLLSPENAMGPTFAVLWWCAAFGMGLWAAALGQGWLGRTVAALATLCSTHWLLATYAGWLPPLTTLAFLPAMFAALTTCRDQDRHWSPYALMATLALALLGGAVQMLLFAAICIGPWLIDSVWFELRKRDWHGFTRLLQRWGVGIAGSLGLTAFMWMPLVAELPLLSRSREVALAGHAGGLGRANLLQLLYPEALGGPLEGHGPSELWEAVLHFGWITPALCVLAFFGRRGTHLVPLRIGLLIGLLLAFDSPILWAAHALVPGLAYFHGPARILHVTAFFAGIVAGLGAEKLSAWLRHRFVRQSCFAVGLALMVVPAGAQSRRYLDQEVPASLMGKPHYWSALQQANQGHDGARMLVVGRAAFNYGDAARLGIELVNGYDPFHYLHYIRLLDRLRFGAVQAELDANWLDVNSIARWDLVDRLNVRFVMSSKPVQRRESPLRLLWSAPAEPVFHFYSGVKSQPVFLYENTAALGRAQFAEASFQSASTLGKLQALDELDSRRVAVLEEHGQGFKRWPPGSVVKHWKRNRSGELEIQAYSPHGGLLTLAEVWHPGWQATVNDTDVIPLRADDGLMAVRVRAGNVRVHLRFVAPLRREGWGVAFITLLAILWSVWHTRRQKEVGQSFAQVSGVDHPHAQS